MEKHQEVPLNEQNACSESERFIAGIPSYPAGRYDGRGIVICGGGVRYFTNAWVCIHMLRRHGCKLPIQIWYLTAKEMDERMKELVRPLGVECVDGREVRKMAPARILNGWELKAYAILHCPFKEVLLLDADNVPVVSPEFLFETPQYQETGAIFWPDYGRLGRDRPIWKICGIEYRDEPEFESGQIVVDKEKCWQAMALSMWYNEHSDFFYNHVHGDKETFHLAFRKVQKAYSMPSKPIHPLDDTMCQHDFEGRRIFQHRNLDKWNFQGGNKRIGGFLFEAECLAYLEELRKQWGGQIEIANRFFPEKRSNKEKTAALALINTAHIYHRVGHDRRGMLFLENGLIGVGAAGREAFWDLRETDGEMTLIISSEDEVTCRLKQDKAGVWRGRWMVFERMPVEVFSAAEPPTPPASSAESAAVMVRTPLNVHTGYGQVGVQLVAGLERMGFQVKIRSSEIQETFAKLPEGILSKLVSQPGPAAWELLLATPHWAPTAGKRTLFFTMWEATRLIPEWVKHLNMAECILVPSQWNASCFSACGVDRPIRMIPLGVDTQVFRYSPMRMEGPCVFGTAGRTEGGGMRKGFDRVMSAFQMAFPSERDVELQVKGFPDCKISTAKDPRVTTIKQFFNEAELARWFERLTCFVSGSRSEGWGLMQHQALATGRPLISVKFGGVAEFFSEEMGYPVSFRLKRAEGIYQNCGHWADPNVDDMAKQMRRVYEQREDARQRGVKGAVMVSQFSWDRTVRELRGVMQEIGMINILIKRHKAVQGKVITFTLCKRPDYTKTVLDALRQCEGVEDYLLLPRVEPVNDEVIALARNIDFAECRVTVNRKSLGCGLNTFCAWQDGFKHGDFIIHLEDDTVPAHDALRYMEHCRDAYAADQGIFSATGYNRDTYNPATTHQIARRAWFTCWLVGTWADRWAWIKNNWNRDSARWGTHLANQTKARRLHEVYPLLSRCQNIGAERGVHVPSPEWHKANHHTEHWAGVYDVKSGKYHEATAKKSEA